MAITLPTSKIPAESQDPKYLILFGLPKVGKTTILATLENNLILDFENGSTYIEALKVKINTLKELGEVCKAIKEAGKPYKFITIDTVTAVEELAKPMAIIRILQCIQKDMLILQNLLNFQMEAVTHFGEVP